MKTFTLTILVTVLVFGLGGCVTKPSINESDTALEIAGSEFRKIIN
jgi:starvation-inducible outer membrane lipoprotein